MEMAFGDGRRGIMHCRVSYAGNGGQHGGHDTHVILPKGALALLAMDCAMNRLADKQNANGRSAHQNLLLVVTLTKE